jgi:AcrR family transcriptional regulator
MVGSPENLSVRERLLKAADDLFYQQDVHTVGIDRILAQAGVAKASLYGTFGSKEELVRAYLEARAARSRGRIERKLDGLEDPRERILAIYDAIGEGFTDGMSRGCPFVRVGAEAPCGPSAAREVALAYRQWRRDLFIDLARQLGAEDAVALGRHLSFLLDGAAVAASLEGEINAPAAAREAAEALLDGLAARKRLGPSTPSKAGSKKKKQK